jgi:predicted component of type VI protein secretion system
MMAFLEIRIAQEVRRIALDRDHLRIGRLAENDIVLRDAQISRHHAELRFTSGHWRIMDLGSTNGLHFKGKRVREHHLNSGDMLLLAPNITLSFREGAAPPDAIPTGRDAIRAVRPPQMPAAPSMSPVPPVAHANSAESPSFDFLRPRSPFADDERPYFPPGMGMPAPPTQYNSQHAAIESSRQPAPSVGQRYPSYPPVAEASQFETLPGGGYPAPAGPMTSGSDGGDPFRRSSPNMKSETHRATAGPTSTLLHVCQTCGQLTSQDSVYCQSCHHSIARECVNCRLSLLPIQDRCPRCQTPNAGSVRRAHRAPGA